MISLLGIRAQQSLSRPIISRALSIVGRLAPRRENLAIHLIDFDHRMAWGGERRLFATRKLGVNSGNFEETVDEDDERSRIVRISGDPNGIELSVRESSHILPEFLAPKNVSVFLKRYH